MLLTQLYTLAGGRGSLWSPGFSVSLSQGTGRQTISYLKLSRVKPAVPTHRCTLELL